MAKPTTSFRIDAHLIKLARSLNINLNRLVEAAIAVAVKNKKCPYCGQNIAKENDDD